MRDRTIKIIIILCLGLSMGLLPVPRVLAQQGSAQTVEISGYSFNTNTASMSPVDYGVVVSKRFLDEDDAATWLDPSGESVFQNLQVEEGIYFGYDQHMEGSPFKVHHETSAYFMDFDDIGGDARFRYLKASKFHMEDDGPLFLDAQRGGGKFVYDIAEAVLAAEGEPADVVVISNDEDITVVKSKKKYDLSVAGVISTDPKIYMGYSPNAKKEGKYKPLALAGIVLCKVSAENGAIKKGDILVSSSVPGHAMRADPPLLTPGMIIGSALQNWDQGEGKIYILVN